MALHFVVIMLSVLIASRIRLGPEWYSTLTAVMDHPIPALAVFALGGVAIFDLTGIYRFDKRWSVTDKLLDTTWGVGVLFITTIAVLFFLGLDGVEWALVAIAFVLTWAGVASTTLGIRGFAVWRRDHGRSVRRAVVVGTGDEARTFVKDLSHDHPELGVDVIGYVGTADEGWEPLPHLGSIADLSNVLATHIVDDILVALPLADWSTIDTATRAALEQGKTVLVPLTHGDYAVSHGEVGRLGGLPVLTVASGPTKTAGLALKRTMDIVASALAMVLLSPVILVVGLVILITDGWPLIYTDHRAGLHGRPIKVHKFRTMVTNADDLRADLAEQNVRVGPDFKIVDDPRITRVGGFLRRSSLDELPQFWDIFVGRMSLVGPRAQRLDEVAGYDAWHRRRLSVKPGLTGLWQVEARQDPSFEVRARLDLEYVDNWSLLLDLKIMLATIPAMLKSTGD
ncbi:MAG: sugar transferase [Actinomycetota bacterium]|nr:sugar transferase [Actinomycetota bacterium]